MIDSIVHSLQMLRRHKRFAALAILSLGVAIALNTTMYSVLDALINPKLDIREPERLYDGRYYGNYRGIVPQREINAEIRELGFHSGVAAAESHGRGRTIERGNILRSARVAVVTPNFHSLLGVRPILGRILSDIDVASEPHTVVLSERMWRQLFPRHQALDDAVVRINGKPMTVVGVLPYEADHPGAFTDAWMVASASYLPDMELHLFRLKDGVTSLQARMELRQLNRSILQRTRDRARNAGFHFSRWIDPQLQGFHKALTAAVVAVLLIACANLANLQLARGVSRTRELATRAAVGASRGDIVRQLILETAWLALGGLAVGALLTAWGMRLVELRVPETLAEFVTRPQMSWRVAAFAGVTTLFCLVTVGLLPALRISRVDVNTLLKSGAGTGQSRKTRRQYGYLVVAEVSLALAVLCAFGLLTQAALRWHTEVPEAYRTVADGQVLIRPLDGDRRTGRAWSELIIQRALSEPEIMWASTSTYGAPSRHAISVDDPGGVPRHFALPRMWSYRIVSSNYLRTLGYPIVAGRNFSPGEFAEPLVIVDQQTAKYLWPGSDPIGKLIKLDSAHVNAPWIRVIGVAQSPSTWRSIQSGQRSPVDQRPHLGSVWVLNAADTSVLAPVESEGSGQVSFQWMSLWVRARPSTTGERAALLLMRAFGSPEPGLQLNSAESYGQGMYSHSQREKHDFIASLFGVFGLCALALAALGVYAVISHSVAQRTREFGVRVAIGASTRQIREMVIRDGTLMTLLGLVGGLLLIWEWGGTLNAFLRGDYDQYDSRVFAVAALVLFGAAWLASWLPARRATRIDPVEALRND